MIQLNVDFGLLNKFFGIPVSRITQYANKDIDEIMKIEAAQGNKKAAEYEKILSDPDKILEIFKLSNVENKFIILQNLNEEDLDKLLPFLNNEQLARGLEFFTEEKLIEMCNKLPKEELLEMVFEKFNTNDILSFMQEDEMDKFIAEPECERKYIQKYFESLDQEKLEEMMTKYYGEEFKGKSQKEYINHLQELNEGDFMDFVFSMEKKDKMNLISNITKQEEDLLLLFEPETITKPMTMLMKEDKIKMMETLKPEFLVPMIQELPADLTQIVLTQIDPRDFAEIIATEFQDILGSVVLFANQMG